MKSFIVHAAFAALCALSLSGCINSSDPILADAQAVFGPRLRLQLFTLREGYAREPERVNYKWNGALYAYAGGGMRDVKGFSVHPFEAGDYIIQETPVRRGGSIEYAILHKLAEGLYQVIAIDEADADKPTRVAHCSKGTGTASSPCLVKTKDQLFAFARATAARKRSDGGLVIRLPDEPERPNRR